MLHDHFLDLDLGPIGRVVTSEDSPATAHEFFFWTAETPAAQNLDIGHIVAAEAEDATAVAVLDDPRRYSDLQSFLDDFYAYDGDPALEALSERVEILVFKARVLATKHRHERKKSKRPVRTGPVFFATRPAIEYALGTDDFAGHKIPMLLHENGNEKNGSPQRTPLFVDGDYLLGPEAGHLNITGMSGLSTKTSHALFTIASTFQTVDDKKVAALMFNVKGADLLYLDKPVEVDPEEDPDLAERYKKAKQKPLPQEDREMYESLGLEIKPFENLRIFAPLAFGKDGGDGMVHAADLRTKDLNTLRNARGEDSCVHPIVWDLEDVLPHAGRIFDPMDYDDKFKGFVEYLRSVPVRTMRGFHSQLDEAFEYFEESESSYWNGHHQATIAKVRNRFGVLPSKCAGLLVHGRVEYGDSPQVDGPFGDREMRVVDISHLSGVPQDLVVTKVINSVWEMAEQGRLGVDKLVIFVDELNKYAPSGSRTSSLKDTLVDISARGRHLNLTLFGAQQFRSKVDDEVVGNAATSLYGRIGDEELTNSSYRSFSGTTREELLQLEKGRLLLRHAHYAVPVFGTFPRPMVLMGKQGTDIFGERKGDAATSVLAVMRNLVKTGKPPAITAIRGDIEGVPEEQVYEALDAVQAAHRTGHGAADPYKNFRWNLTRNNRPARRRESSQILSGLDRMRD
ncbi:MAG: Bipolar DNA helicase HerA [uncultured Rubrobacteraceae bacterium]|uniref:Bipolar DNA helicase HerA n=1 Tax=uncultured Rubrobacteraceae bacterium TaxID=349277 RepID=A0A6J4PT00_9ACTN|nr:MAG: Bipolar DNA helicase HerA [uncultured Rubrobacteraceae bacterium]